MSHANICRRGVPGGGTYKIKTLRQEFYWVFSDEQGGQCSWSTNSKE